MLALLEFLLYGHSHIWQKFEERKMVGDYGFAQNGQFTRHICRCQKCGKIKYFDA